MPYIPRDHRFQIDDVIDNLVVRVENMRDDGDLPPEKVPGLANYVITRLLLRLLRPDKGWNYASLATVLATLEASKLEIYRRMVAPYEEVAATKNGDVPEFDLVQGT